MNVCAHAHAHARGVYTCPVSYPDRVDLLLVGADPPDAHVSVPTAGAVRPGEVARLAHQLAIGLARAPQTSARRLHEGTGLGALPEGQLTLPLQAIGGPGQPVRQGQGLLRLVQQTFPWTEETERFDSASDVLTLEGKMTGDEELGSKIR